MTLPRRLSPILLLAVCVAAMSAGLNALTQAQATPTPDPFATVNARVTELAETPDPFATVNARATSNAATQAAQQPTAEPTEPPTPTPTPPIVQTLSIEPQRGPNGTTHVISASALTPGREYRLVLVYRPRSATVFDGPLTASDTGEVTLPLMSERADPPGVYDVFLYDGDAIIGVGSLEVLVAELAAADVLATLTSGTPVQGLLNFDAAIATYAFTARAGDVVTIDLLSSDFNAFLLLAGGDGVVLTRNDDGGAGQNARITTYELPADDTYLIGVTSRDAAESAGRRTVRGDYTLLMRLARFAEGGPMEGGEIVVGELTTDRQRAEFTFEARADDTVTIDLGSEAFDPLLRLRAPNGREIATDDDGGPGLYARIRIRLPENGTYTIVVDGNRGFTGNRVISGRYALTLEFDDAAPAVVQPPAPTPTVAVAQPPATGGDTLSITIGDNVTGALTRENQRVLYTFTGRAGEVVTISLESDDFDTVVTLLNAAGEELISDDDGGSGLNSLISGFTLPADGQYTIVVDGYRGVQGDRELLGTFRLSLTAGPSVAQATPTSPPPAAATPTSPPAQATQPPAAATPTPLPTLPPTPVPSEPGRIASGETVTGALTAQAQTVQYVFTATAGQAVTIALNGEGFDPLLRLLDVSGVELAFDDDSGGGLNARISNFILATSGDYTIVVDAFRGLSGDRIVLGTFTLTLQITETGLVQATPTAPPDAPTPTPVEPTVTAAPVEPTAAPPTPTPLIPTLRPGAIATPQPAGFDQVLSATFFGTADERATFRFGAVAGDIVTISTNSNGSIDTSMELVGPNGEILATDDDGGISFDPELQGIKLPDTGEYVVVLRPFNPGDRGTIELTVKLLSPAMLDSGAQIIQINSKNPAQALMFNGVRGETVRLSIRSISQVIGTPSFTVTQGDKLLASNTVGQNLRLSFDFAVTDDGPVLITVTGGDEGSAVLEVSFERLP